ncbi:MAG: hypothetical protein WC509_03990 [Candidatus Izemoplasmatales bacterium]
MPIFESIRTAEEKAEALRAKAQEEAKTLLERARMTAAEETARIQAETDAKVAAVEAEAAARAERESRRIAAEAEASADADAARAKNARERALAAVMKKVTGV